MALVIVVDDCPQLHTLVCSETCTYVLHFYSPGNMANFLIPNTPLPDKTF